MKQPLARLLQRGAAALGVNQPERFSLWLLRLFILPPAPPGPKRRVPSGLAWLAKRLEVSQPDSLVEWLARLLMLPPGRVPPARALPATLWRWLKKLFGLPLEMARRVERLLPSVDWGKPAAVLEQAGRTVMGRNATRRVIFSALSLAAMVLAATSPLNDDQQLAFLLILWTTAWMLRRMPGHHALFATLLLSVLASARYLWWRISDIQAMEIGADWLLSYVLLAAEGHFVLLLLLDYALCAYNPPLAANPPSFIPQSSEAPKQSASLAEIAGQSLRSAHETVQALRRNLLPSPVPCPRLSLARSILHAFYAIPRLVFFCVPLAYWFLGLRAFDAPSTATALYVLPHLLHASLADSRLQSFPADDGQLRPQAPWFSWRPLQHSAMHWYAAVAVLLALLPGDSKNRSPLDFTVWSLCKAHLAFGGLNLLGLALGIHRYFQSDSGEVDDTLFYLAWSGVNLALLGIAIGLAVELRRRSSMAVRQEAI